MKQILVLNTGGTIGMQATSKGLTPETGFLEQYVRMNILPLYHDLEITWFDFDPLIDSSQISVDDWNNIGNKIENHIEEFDAFLIVHGTDTLAFTSSYLGLAFKNLPKPVVITGSMRSIQEENSDGPGNLRHSIMTCLTEKHKGVFVCFNNRLLPGEHVSKVDASDIDAFRGPVSDNIPLLTVEGKFQRLEAREQDIDIFTFFPGCSYQTLAFMADNSSKAIIIRSFGSGNAPSSLELKNAIERAIQNNKIVINMSQCLGSQVDMHRYAAAEHLRELGVISAYTMSLEAIITKLILILSFTEKQEVIKKEFIRPWAREIPNQSTNQPI